MERAAADPNHARKAAATLSDGIKLHLAAFTELAAQGKRSTDTIAFYRQKHGQLIRFFETEPVTEKYTPYPLSQLSADAVDRYISHRRSEKVVDHTIHKELTALRAMLKRSKRAGLWSGDARRDLHDACARAKLEPCSPNDLRRSFAHLLRNAGAPVELLVSFGRNFARHSSVG